MIERVEGLLSRFRKLQEAQPIEDKVNSRYTHIAQTVNQASKIWFDRRGKKQERRHEAAHKFVQQLTSEILSDPQFYQAVDDGTHLRTLDLLFEIVPARGQMFETFMEDTVQTTIESYLRGFVKNRNMPEERMVSDLKTFASIPTHYAERVYPRIGLPLPIKRQDFSQHV